MICQNCHLNTANIKISQVFADNRYDFYLCIDCAQKFGLDDPFSELPVEFEKFIKSLPSPEGAETKEALNIICSGCGLDLKTFEENGLLGCPACYIAFEDILKTILRRYHGSNRHSRLKKSMLAELLSDDKLTNLKNKLKTALESEDFEEAAILRDEITALRNIKRKKS